MDILSAFGFSSSAGLNAYLPLLIAGLTARFTDLLELGDPWNTLENGWVLALLTVLLAVEVAVDKIPGVDTVNDVISTVVRPVAGALLFAASTEAVTGLHPAVSMGLGLVTAGTVHATKTTARPVVTASTAGVGNPVVSTVEDLLSGIIAICAVLLPIIAGILAALLLIPALMLVRRMMRSAAAPG